MIRLRALFAGFLCGATLALPFLAETLEPLAWVAAIPLLVHLGTDRPRHRVLFLLATGFSYIATGLFWLWRLSPAFVVTPALFFSPYFLLFLLVGFLRRRRPGLPLWTVAPVLWAFAQSLTESLTPYPTTWLAPGYTQADRLSLLQSAEWIGVHGVTFVVLLVNAALADLLLALAPSEGPDTRPRAPRRLFPAFAGLMTAAAVVSILLSAGSLRLRMVESSLREGPEVLLVQGNITGHDKHDAPNLRKHVLLTLSDLRSTTDLVVWPETTVDVRPEVPGEGLEVIRDLALRFRVAFLFGAEGLTVEDGERRFANSAFLFGPGGEPRGRYDKIVLVPFGEYIPFLGGFRGFRERAGSFISRVFGFSPSYRPGEGVVLLPFEHEGETLRAGPLICYEDTLAGLTRRFARAGADLLVNISNEDWYYDREMDQHLDMAVFRAVENRLPLVRATNSGVTCVIDPTGRVSARLAVGGRDRRVAGTLAAPTRLSGTRPPARSGPALFGWICGAALAGIALAALRRSPAGA